MISGLLLALSERRVMRMDNITLSGILEVIDVFISLVGLAVAIIAVIKDSKKKK
jgi:hypothetical protein